ncbi:MAG TPA: hypothetical protein VFI68_12155 [Anaerolineales bacterium]|nr:hypothetical protein [Anaerolineales bacterium]
MGDGTGVIEGMGVVSGTVIGGLDTGVGRGVGLSDVGYCVSP